MVGFAAWRGIKAGAAWGALSGFLYIAAFAPVNDVDAVAQVLVAVAWVGFIAAMMGAVVGMVVGLFLGMVIGVIARAVRAPSGFPGYVAAALGAASAVPLVWLLLAFRDVELDGEELATIALLTLLPMITATAAYRHAAAVCRHWVVSCGAE